MPQAPVWPFSIGDYLQDTNDLSTEEHGAYLLLLMAQWSRHGEPLPNDPKRLARITRCENIKQWKKVAPEVLKFFKVDDSFVSHERIVQDFQRVQEKIETNRANAARGGRNKSLKNNNTGSANAKPNAKANARAKSERTPSKRSSKRNSEPPSQTSSESLPTHEPLKNPSYSLNEKEERTAEQIFEGIDAEMKARWPNDPTPRDARMLEENSADFAAEGANADVVAAALVGVWPRLTRPPGTLTGHRDKVIATVRHWVELRRWVDGGRKTSSPWRLDWGDPPDDQVLANFEIPVKYRLAGEAVMPTMPTFLDRNQSPADSK